jgi:ribosome recycling factor
MSDDYKERVEDDIQKIVDDTNKKIDAILAEKQQNSIRFAMQNPIMTI